jgi:hypothetical protein
MQHSIRMKNVETNIRSHINEAITAFQQARESLQFLALVHALIKLTTAESGHRFDRIDSTLDGFRHCTSPLTKNYHGHEVRPAVRTAAPNPEIGKLKLWTRLFRESKPNPLNPSLRGFPWAAASPN